MILRLAALLLIPSVALGQAQNRTPQDLADVDIVDRSGERVPADIRLVDESGREVLFGDFLGRGRPLLVQLVYFGCPMLCTMVLNGFLDGAKGLDWTPGVEYDVLTVSFDPRDTPEIARAKKETHVAALGRPEAASGWRFLTGEAPQVRALADALGFRYRWFEDKKEFAHGAGMFALTPDGTVSRTLYGIAFSARDLKLSLAEASEGRLGSPFDKLLLYCFRYDEASHKYALVARNVMKVGGALTVGTLAVFLTLLWTRERGRSRAAKPARNFRARGEGHA